MNINKRFRVLYVEDNRDSFEMLRVMLGLSQIDLQCAVTVSEASIRAGTERFDLFLLDTGLPDGSGINLCSTLRAFHPQVPVLFYSGEAHAEDIRLAMAAGADGYITKPHSDKLAATIMRLVADQHEMSRPLASLPRFAAAAA
jgi:DNA-binding response OmpR family regulator